MIGKGSATITPACVDVQIRPFCLSKAHRSISSFSGGSNEPKRASERTNERTNERNERASETNELTNLRASAPQRRQRHATIRSVRGRASARPWPCARPSAPVPRPCGAARSSACAAAPSLPRAVHAAALRPQRPRCGGP